MICYYINTGKNTETHESRTDMRTYNVISKNGKQINLIPVEASTAKTLLQNNPGAKKVAIKAWFYRGDEVIIHEERQNGWTLVSNVNGMNPFRYAVTSELEYK